MSSLHVGEARRLRAARGSPEEAVERTCHDDRDLERNPTFNECLREKMPAGTESLGFDVNESEQYMDYVKRTHSRQWRFMRWVLLSLIGLCAGLVAIAVDFSIEVLAEWRTQLNDWVVAAVKDIPGGVWLQYLSFVGFRLAMAAVAGYLVCYVEVLAAGSGIPEIKCYLNGVHLKSVVGLRVLVAKAVGIVFSVAAGLPVGKEGPMIHSGAIVGGTISRLRCEDHVLQETLPPFSTLEHEKRDLVAAGASAGVSAAFGAPVGSVLFAIEEGTSHINPSIVMRIFVSCSIAALVSRLFSSVKSDFRFGHLGTSVPVSFGRLIYADYDIEELIFFTFIALIGGASGSFFNSLNKQLSLWRQRHIPPRGLKRFLEVIVVDFLIASIMFWIPVWASGGGPLESEGLTPTLKLFWQTGTEAMKDLIHEGEDFHMGWLAIFTILNFQLSCLTYGLGVPSGLFVPSLLTGAGYGRLIGQAVRASFQKASHYGEYALIGAVANLAGAARITISLAMIVMETTGGSFSLPIFFAVMVSRWTGNALHCITEKGIYDMHIIELKHIPFLEYKPEQELHSLQVQQVMATKPVSFEVVETVQNLLNALEHCTHHGFPVVFPGSLHLAGTVRRSVLLRLLEYAQEHQVLQGPVGEVRRLQPIPYEALIMAPTKPASFEQLREKLGPDCMHHRLDLWPYINRNGYMMPAYASIASCYKLFRQLGLRHLPIIKSDGDLCGIVTRKDLILCEDGEPAVSDTDERSDGTSASAASEAYSPTTFAGGLGI